MTPWTDRSGQFSALKSLTFVGLFLPAMWIAWSFWSGGLGARPIMAAIHETGDWTVRFLLLSLAVTPLRRIGKWPRLVLVRRMIGLAAMAYALLHLMLYAAELKFDIPRVASEIVLRIYLTIGFVALVGLALLGATSTDRAVRRLGRNWGRLHRAVYGIGVLALLHFFMQSKLDVTQATLMTGLFYLAVGYRVADWRGFRSTPPVLAVVAVGAAMATALTEVGWFAAATGVDPVLILAANLDFSYSVRPVWWVLGAGTLIALVPLLRRRDAETPVRRRRPPGLVAGGPADEHG